MQISKNNPIFGLKKVIEQLFEVKIDQLGSNKYHPDLSQSLKEMYEIDAFFSKDCCYDTIHFFGNQDRLIKYEKLDLESPSFEFLRENQYNWACETQLKSNKVYFNDRVEPTRSCFLDTPIDELLCTFGLQEIGFNLKYYFGLHYSNMEVVQAYFEKVVHLWTDETYLYEHPYSYYLIDDVCLVMWAGMYVFSTNNKKKYEKYKALLDYYNF